MDHPDHLSALRLAHLLEVCRSHGVRITEQRRAILRAVADGDAHPDAETVLARVRAALPHVSLDTVYRGLALLERIGVLNKVTSLHGAARFDANTNRHHHFVCIRCGRIRDFCSPLLDDFPPPPEVCEMGRVNSVHAELRGICAECLAQDGSAADPAPSTAGRP